MHDAAASAEARIRFILERQPAMATIGARLVRAAAGEAELEMAPAAHLLQQNGYVHAGIVTTLVDTACGVAAFTTMREGVTVLTAEFKMNLMAPATGDRLIAIGRVVKAGKTLTVTMGECFAETGGKRRQVALMTATMMAVEGRETVP